ncbi:hypothetical protein CTI12_AA486200 [Artemisia annua]|uniref:Protein kinase domain-containing protein n=1 Tax=Artemisia annua TaxID=35608 RepID=A0A2U1LJ66_ARTAN|nr:hypothetical protein CTI12_AA486200 [Artemisia annua]
MIGCSLTLSSFYCQNHAAASTITIRSHPHQNLEHLLIPLEEIRLATSDFSDENRIGEGGFGKVYKGQLPGRWENRTAAFKRHDPESEQGEADFQKELQMMSSLRHKNIIRLIGYCDEDGEMILIYDYAVNGSLRSHLDKQLMKHITWVQRLKICIGAAIGLKHLQTSHGKDKILVHRDFNSYNILLDDNMEPLICGLGLSIVVDRNKGQVYDKLPVGAFFYMDPIYRESGLITSQTDVYPLGVILFEMLHGLICNMLKHGYEVDENDEGLTLINVVRRSSNDNAVFKLIDWHIIDEIDIGSFLIFKEIAYKCISLNLKDRPSLNRIIKRLEEALRIQEQADASTIATQSQLSHQDKKLEDFRIPLEEIRLATGKFSKIIGMGGFGVVYKGQFSERWQNCSVAIKRLSPEGHQGNDEFQNELNMMFKFHHKNIINFLGYCDEDKEMIIVNEYASNGSLEDYLADVLDKKRHEMDRRSFHTFKFVAYECISLNSKDRPTMDTIIDRLEEALEFQVSFSA